MTRAKKTHINLIVLLFVTIAFAVIVQHYSAKENTNQKTKTDTKRPDFYLSKAITRVMDKSGKKHYELTTERISHNPNTNESKLFKPKITTENKNSTKWQITSDKGTLPDHQEHAILTGNVVTKKFSLPVISNENSIPADLTATTDQLIYDTKKQKIISQGNVTINTSSSLVTGNEMVADIPTDTMEITTNVKANITPKN
ncbi:MAG: LPS export ABC transporter periplasmic protein LptC [Gammaproteobacteria bacterium]|nr:MAG: LPS export ABC transporter periplasmic protein LptC [Gammaproteobacteria bacterium]